MEIIILDGVPMKKLQLFGRSTVIIRHHSICPEQLLPLKTCLATGEKLFFQKHVPEVGVLEFRRSKKFS